MESKTFKKPVNTFRIKKALQSGLKNWIDLSKKTETDGN